MDMNSRLVLLECGAGRESGWGKMDQICGDKNKSNYRQ